MYGQAFLESIRAVVQTVPKDTFLHLVDESSPRRAEVRKVGEGNEKCETEHYCVSRVSRSKCEESWI